jgi:hypothetical protein
MSCAGHSASPRIDEGFGAHRRPRICQSRLLVQPCFVDSQRRCVKPFTLARWDLSYPSGRRAAVYRLIKQGSSIMWTLHGFVASGFLLAVTVAGLGMVALAFG